MRETALSSKSFLCEPAVASQGWAFRFSVRFATSLGSRIQPKHVGKSVWFSSVSNSIQFGSVWVHNLDRIQIVNSSSNMVSVINLDCYREELTVSCDNREASRWPTAGAAARLLLCWLRLIR
ncbi:hypothetical protein CISIN_1g033344mg [Citrus sinensis]|uniref:Uncharacterized protein n=1 Tax=Citrus sinensis TaxID=2711 RepID=A0A067EMM3_CITSI|nr:hypothetical protein CISIN_1g033344mg [Citrus sinensis]